MLDFARSAVAGGRGSAGVEIALVIAGTAVTLGREVQIGFTSIGSSSAAA